MAVIMRVDGSYEEVQPENGRDFQLAQLQKIVGGYIEIVPVGEKMILVIDEEGKLKPEKGLNPYATVLYLAYGGGDEIVGDVLLCKTSEVK